MPEISFSKKDLKIVAVVARYHWIVKRGDFFAQYFSQYFYDSSIGWELKSPSLRQAFGFGIRDGVS